MMRLIIPAAAGAVVVLWGLLAQDALAEGGSQTSNDESKIPGIRLSSGSLRARVTNNVERFISQTSNRMNGYNGLAALQERDQRKNIFVHAGLNYETASVDPKTGPLKDNWKAPRVAPMTIEKIRRNSVKLTQKGSEASGVNMETVYTLGKTYVDMTCMFWADNDVKQIKTFWASYMNQVQNTSLFLRAKLDEKGPTQWLEAASPTHKGPIGYRPFDPTGRDWYDYLTDNPVRRQVMRRSPEIPAARAAQKKAGFEPLKLVPGSFENFFYGFVDDYLFLMIFRPSDDMRFHMWLSPTGGGGVRSPAWDFSANSARPTKGGEKITWSVRLVYKKFAGLDDVLKEVERFQKRKTGSKK